MNIIRQEGLSMPVSQELINIIFSEICKKPPLKPNNYAITLLFKDVNYSFENGGFHPVEIRLISRNDEWCFDYITDFKYMGYVFLSYAGDLPPGEGCDIFALWQRNFAHYHFLNIYTPTVIWES